MFLRQSTLKVKINQVGVFKISISDVTYVTLVGVSRIKSRQIGVYNWGFMAPPYTVILFLDLLERYGNKRSISFPNVSFRSLAFLNVHFRST